MKLDPPVIEALARCAPELDPRSVAEGFQHVRGRQPGFENLVRIVVEQAVSQASAQAIWARLHRLVDPFDPPTVLSIGSEALRGSGLSRGKARCAMSIAEAIEAGRLDLSRLEACPDQDVRRALVGVPGIGRWTADVYLLLALRRSDVWPAQDLALQEAVRVLYAFSERPRARELDTFGDRFRPFRSGAALLLWERYIEAKAVRKKALGPE